MKKSLIIIALIMVISNLPPFNFLFIEDFTYTNFDKSFNFSEEGGKGFDFETAKIRYARFLNQHPQIKDKTLYRTFTIKPWRFWEWSQMVFHSERFLLPYKSL